MSYGVESYHIAVGSGDGAIHLLVSSPDTADAKVLRAILVDAGLNNNSVVKNIQWTMKSIVTKYGIVSTSPTKTLQFDAIIITHWDEDHYEGVEGLIEADIVAQAATGTVDPDTILIGFMKYGSAGRSDPQTVMYAPYWTRPKPTLNGPPENFKPDTGKLDYKNFKAICRLNTDSILGVNFFENKLLSGSATIASPQALFAANPPVDQAMPGVYCVASNQKSFHVAKTTGIVDVVNFPGTTATNLASIFAMVIWKNGQLSHYFAGDADYVMEDEVLQWSGTSGDTATPGGSITSMKLSHHGAKKSTPTDIIDNYSPKNVIISCGSTYGHPSWEILVYLYASYLKRGGATAGSKPIYCTRYPHWLAKDALSGLYNSIYFVSANALKADYAGKDKKAFQDFVKSLQNLYNEINKTTTAGGTTSPDIVQDFATWRATGTKSAGDMKQWICGVMEGLWSIWSHTEPSSLPASSAGFTGPNTVAIFNQKQYIRYILVKCRAGATDGDVLIRYVGEVDDLLPVKVPVSPGTNSAKANNKQSLYRYRPYTVPKPKKFGGWKGVRTTKYYQTPEATDPLEMSTDDSSNNSSDEAASLGKLAALEVKSEDDDDSSTYYMYGTDLTDELPAGVTILAAGTDLDEFVNILHRCVIGLVSELTADSVTEFDGKDEWFCWLQDSIDITELFVIASDDATTITGFDITMTSPADTILPTPPDTPSSPLKFSTTFAAFALGFDDDLSTSLPGYVSEATTLAFGLDTTSSELDMTLSDVFKYVGLTNIASSPVITLMGVINLSLKPQDSKGDRNLIWFNPNQAYSTIVRLQFSLADGSLDDLNKFLQKAISGFTLDTVAVIAKKNCTWVLASDGVAVVNDGQVTLTANWTFNGSTKFAAAVEFRESRVTLELQTTTTDVLDDILTWLASVCGESGFDLGAWLKNIETSAKPQLRRITLTINIDDQTPKISAFSIDLEVGVKFGTAGESLVVFLLSYNWTKGSGSALTGALWCAPPAALDYAQFLPAWEEYLKFEPITKGPLSEALELSTMIPDEEKTVKGIPDTIAPTIFQASLEIDGSGIEFSGTIVCPVPVEGLDPVIYLSSIELYATYTFSGKIFNLAFDMTALIQPAADSIYPEPTMMTGTINYDGALGTWKLNASLKDLYASTLYSFFDKTSRDGGVMTFLERLEIKYLSLEYDYLPDGNEFHFTGTILLGELELDLNYDYSPKDWTFAAKLKQDTDKTSNIGEIVNSIIGSAADDLPSFVASISVSKDDGVSIACKKNSGGSLLFAGSISISGFQVSIVQYRDSTWAQTTPPKRAIKVSINKLPDFDVPLIGNLAQPFDEMYYLWVQDSSNQNLPDVGPGLTQPEVDSINSELSTLPDELLVKKVSSTPKDTDVVIAAGSHFVLVLKEKEMATVVLDYVFGKPKSTTEGGEESALEKTEDNNSSSSDSSMAAYKKSIGPLSISNIGFQLKGDTLSILLDAKFLLGPIGFTLIGFGLGLDFSAGFNLNNLPTVVPSLHGLSVEFNRPPVVIAGMFEHTIIDKADLYVGGVIVTFEPYLFEAAGYYGTIDLNGTKTPTAFIFGLLDGPLVELEFAEISGITGGFGYNCAVKYPSVDEILQFPFISMKSAPSDPMATLLQLVSGPGAWFSPSVGSFWVAAGLKVTAFETLVIDAVVVVEWNPSVSLGIFGVAAADVPASPDIKEKFARVELGIVATVEFSAGIMKFEAQLTPNSYVLSPDCHLTGGFALYYWFEGSDPSMQGNWVFTLGGYHQAFQRPSQYPNPPRLAISWSLDGSINITGQAYFAITPKVCMGGGLLHASLSLGPLEAFFDAYADFLINYKPFHFIADAGVSVGVRFTLDLWIVTIHISVEIGAQLYIQGPPFSGTVHVDFWVFGFDINFGPGADPVIPVTLAAFYELVYQASTQPGASVLSLVKPDQDNTDASTSRDHIFSCQSGQIPPSSTGSQVTPEGNPWVVRAAGLSFGITSRMAINTAKLAGNSGNSTTWPTSIYAKPMQLQTPLQSSMTITIKSNPAPPESYSWKIEAATKSVPDALWGIYVPGEDPSNSGSDISNLLNGDKVAISLMMGVIINAPDPILSNDVIPQFNAVQEASENVFPADEEKYFPPANPSNGDWLPLKDSGTDQWSEVKVAWEKPNLGKGSAESTVNIWSKVFDWTPLDPLSGAPPTNLLNDIGNLYLDAPLLSALSNTDDAA